MAHAIIMAGGRGTRFWPQSRQVRAKQFLSLIDDKSFLEHSVERILPLVGKASTWIVGNLAQRELLMDCKGAVPEENVLLEPCGRNTAPCIAYAARKLLERDKDAIMVVLPSDHMIQPQSAFLETIQLGIDTVKKDGGIVTIGISPSSPHTGYGYIEASEASDVSKVAAFKEKPDLAQATQFLAAGNYYWNAGIFIWRADLVLDLIAQHFAPLYTALDGLLAVEDDAAKFAEAYAALPSESIDYAIMEHAADITKVIRASFTWSDIGSWTALADFLDVDDANNAVNGQLVAQKSSGNIVYSPKRLVSLLGVDDLIVVDSDDAILIAKKQDDQDIKTLVDQLPEDYL